MSEVQPTQGRITFTEDGDANHYSMLTEDGRWWLAILANGEQTSARQVANFRRLAACWNACEGSSTEWLEFQCNPDAVDQFGKPEPFETRYQNALRKGMQAMEKRDELLDALKGLQGRLLRCIASGASAAEAFDSFYQGDVNDIIAKSEGEQHE